MDRTTHWKVVEQHFTVVLFVFFNFTQFVKFTNFGLGTVGSERVKNTTRTAQSNQSGYCNLLLLKQGFQNKPATAGVPTAT